jgi:hypothetical protein
MNDEKKWFAIAVILLFTSVTLIPTITADTRITSSEKQYDEVEKIFNDLKVKLEKVTTKQEALILFKETIMELWNHGLLPKGMNAQQIQRLVTQAFLKSELLHPSQMRVRNDTGNTNCLVVGFATKTYFRPFPAIIFDIPLIYSLIWESSLSDELNPLALFYVLRTFQPFKFGPYAYVGGRHKGVEDGNITDDIYPATGLVWTIGANGIKKWAGSFYGGLYTKYWNRIYENNTYEWWDPVGIRGFVGINFFNFISFASSNDYPSFYIGFAREVNFTYSHPWT